MAEMVDGEDKSLALLHARVSDTIFSIGLS
jgi:hypothetical protein